MEKKTCAWCGKPMPPFSRDDATYCSGRCRVGAYRARIRAADKPKQGAVTHAVTTPLSEATLDNLAEQFRHADEMAQRGLEEEHIAQVKLIDAQHAYIAALEAQLATQQQSEKVEASEPKASLDIYTQAVLEGRKVVIEMQKAEIAKLNAEITWLDALVDEAEAKHVEDLEAALATLREALKSRPDLDVAMRAFTKKPNGDLDWEPYFSFRDWVIEHQKEGERDILLLAWALKSIAEDITKLLKK
jgi:hypothetical protein